MQLSIVIVTWNCAAHLQRCLASVFASHVDFNYEVIVVDNASTDSTCSDVAQQFGSVNVVALPENLGFAKANNIGLRIAGGEYLLLLNPDTILPRTDSLASLASMLDGNPKAAAAGPRLEYPDGSHQVGDAGYRPTLWHVVCHSLGLSVLAPRMFRGLFLTKRAAQGKKWLAVDWICGACLLVRRDVIETVGGLDERFFLYGEDVELGCRMRRAGHCVIYVPTIAVVHVQGGTQFQDIDAPVSVKWLDSLASLYVDLNRDRHWPLFKAALAVGFNLRWAAYYCRFLQSRRVQYLIKARAMARYGRHIRRLARPAVMPSPR